MKDLKEKTKISLNWSLKRQLAMQLLNLLIGIIMARVLMPEDFGSLALVMILVSFVGVFMDMGLGNALIYETDKGEGVYATAFWATLGSGFLLAVFITLMASFWAGFFDKPILEYISYCLALDFFLSSLSSIPVAFLKKELRFRRIFYMDVTATLVAGLTGIILAVYGFGVWSLVFKVLLFSVLRLVFLVDFLFVASFAAFSLQAIRKLFRFSLPLVASNTLNYFVRNVDDFLVGKVLGGDALGIYNRSYAILLLPVRQVSGVFSSVLFPSFSKMDNGAGAVAATYLKVSRLIAFLAFPAMLGICVLREPLVLAILGDDWAALIPLVGVLSVLGMLQSISSLNGTVFLSQGATDLQFKLGLFTKTFVVLCLFVGINYGLLGLTIAYTIGSVAAAIPEFFFVGKLLGLNLRQLLSNLLPSLFISFVMALGLFAVDEILQSWAWQHWLRLSIGVLAGLSSYLIMHMLFATNILDEMKAVVREQLAIEK